jgi:hypothetical protein
VALSGGIKGIEHKVVQSNFLFGLRASEGFWGLQSEANCPSTIPSTILGIRICHLNENHMSQVISHEVGGTSHLVTHSFKLTPLASYHPVSTPTHEATRNETFMPCILPSQWAATVPLPPQSAPTIPTLLIPASVSVGDIKWQSTAGFRRDEGRHLVLRDAD